MLYFSVFYYIVQKMATVDKLFAFCEKSVQPDAIDLSENTWTNIEVNPVSVTHVNIILT